MRESVKVCVFEEVQQSTLPLVLEYDEKYDKAELEEVVEQCKLKDPVALYELASRYRCGVDDVEADERKAVELYSDVLLQQRHVMAVKYIGRAYEEGVLGEECEKECVRWYELGSKWGGGSASESLGLLYSEGKFVELDYDKAIQLFNLAISQGNKHAYFNLGDVYRKKQEYTKARVYFEKAIELEKVYFSYIFLGQFYEDGLGVEKNLEKAFLMYSLAYKYGIQEDGAYDMGRMYFYGRGVKEDDNKAYQLFQEALEGGILEANYFLGLLNYLDNNPQIEKNATVALEYLDKVPEYMQGMAMERKGYIFECEGNEEEAKVWYEKAANLNNQQAIERLKILNESKEDKQLRYANNLLNANVEQLLAYYERGDENAIYLLADAYYHGKKGATVNYEKAYKYYKEVIEKETPSMEQAQVGLASMFLDGKAVPKNTNLAITYLESAAQKKYGPACAMLGMLYSIGDGVEIDMKKAVFWYRKGAECNNSVCHAVLAELYFKGWIDNRKNLEQGIIHLQKALAIDGSDSVACWYMAEFLYTGVIENGKILLNKNIAEAIKYYETAAENGYVKAYGKLGGIYSNPESSLYNYEYALQCYEKGLSKGDIWAAASLAGLHLLPEFKKERAANPRRGIEMAKLFLEKGDGTRGLKEYVMDMAIEYYNSCGEASAYSQEGYYYLLNCLGNMGLAYTTEENRTRLIRVIRWAYSRIVAHMDHKNKNSMLVIIQMLERLEKVTSNNSYIKSACQDLIQTEYLEIAKVYLKSNQLQNAKKYFEKSAWSGCREAERYLARFKTNMFGNLTFN